MSTNVPSHLQNSRPAFASIRRMTATIKSTVKGKKIVFQDEEPSFGLGSDWELYYDVDGMSINREWQPPTKKVEIDAKYDDEWEDDKTIGADDSEKISIDEFGCFVTKPLSKSVPPTPAPKSSTPAPEAGGLKKVVSVFTLKKSIRSPFVKKVKPVSHKSAILLNDEM